MYHKEKSIEKLLSFIDLICALWLLEVAGNIFLTEAVGCCKPQIDGWYKSEW